MIKSLTECPPGRTGATCTGYDVLSTAKAASKASIVSKTGAVISASYADKGNQNMTLLSNFTTVVGVLPGYISTGKLCAPLQKAEELCDGFEDCRGISRIPGDCMGADEWSLRSSSNVLLTTNSNGLISRIISRPNKTKDMTKTVETPESQAGGSSAITQSSEANEDFNKILVLDSKNGDDNNDGTITSGTVNALKQISTALTKGTTDESLLIFTYPTTDPVTNAVVPYGEANKISTTEKDVVISAAYNEVDEEYYETVLVGRTSACDRLLQVNPDTSLKLVGLTIDGSCQWWDSGRRRLQTKQDGGAIEVRQNGYLKLDSVTVKNISVSGNGGAVIVRSGGTLHLENVDVSECTATNGGFAYLESNATLIISGQTTIENCIAREKGGAIYASNGAKLVLTAGFDGSKWDEIVIANNVATEGGGIYLDPGSILSHRGLIVEFNKANMGGGISVHGANVIGIPDNSKLFKGLVGSDLRFNEAVVNPPRCDSVNGNDLTCTIFTTAESCTGIGEDGTACSMYPSVIEGTSGTSSDEQGFGGGIYVNGDDVELDGFNITSCRGVQGAGIFIRSQLARLKNMNVIGNEAGMDVVSNMEAANGKGGGIFIIRGDRMDSVDVKVSNTLIKRNKARTCVKQTPSDPCSFKYHEGGGLYGENVNLHVDNVRLVENVASLGGGALVKGANAIVMFLSTTFYQNEGKNAGGGGLAILDSTVTYLNKTYISENVASGKGQWGLGGGVHVVGSTLYVNQTTMIKNVASNGGAIYAASAHVDNLLSSVMDNEGRAPEAAVQEIKVAFPEPDQEYTDSIASNDGNITDPYAIMNVTVQTFVLESLKPMETQVHISQSDFFDNSAGIAGSEISVELMGASVEIQNVNFISANDNDDRVQDPSHALSSIYVAHRGMLVVKNTIISECVGQHGGYASVVNNGNVLMSNLTVENCSADKGGFLHLSDSSVSLADSSFKNCSGNGAIIYGSGSVVNINGLSASDFDSDGYAIVINSGSSHFERVHITDSIGGAISVIGQSNNVLKNISIERVVSNEGTLNFGGTSISSIESISIASCTSVIGGGIGLDDKASVNCNNCSLIGNTASNVGGGIASTSTFQGTLTMSNSSLQRNLAAQDGAGIAIFGGTMSIKNAIFEQNEANGGGGGFYVAATTATLAHVTVTKNVAGDEGGAMIIRDGATLSISWVVFNENNALRGGGAVDIEKSLRVKIYNSSFDSNFAQKGEINNCGTDADTMQKKFCSTGGIHISGSKNVHLIDTNFTENTGGYGGALFIREGSEVLIKHAVAAGNTADMSDVADTKIRANIDKSYSKSGGGFAYVSEESTLHIEISQFHDNVAKGASGCGGAFYVSGSSDIVLEGNVLSNNSAEANGGHIFAEDTKVRLGNCQLKKGSANKHGGAFYLKGRSCNVEVQKTLIHENTASLGGGFYIDGGVLRLHQNSALTNNQATGLSGNGGALYATSMGICNCNNATISENIAEGNGGALFASDKSIISINMSTISKNKAHGKGGGACFVEKESRLYSERSYYLENHYIPLTIANPVTGEFEVSNTNADSETDTCTILPQNGGGAALFLKSLATFEDCMFTKNRVSGVEANGGAILADHKSNFAISSCVFESNTANEGVGGAVKVAAESTGDIILTKFVSNTAINGYGGSIAVQDPRTEIRADRIEIYGVRGEMSTDILKLDSTWYTQQGRGPLHAFKSLSVMSQQGGGFYAEKQSTVIISNSYIIGANAVKGGGIYGTTKSQISIKNSKIQYCLADNGGGAYAASGSQLNVDDNSEISDNAVKFDGGAIFIAEATATMNFAIIWRNQAPNAYGGGIYVGSGGKLVSIDTHYTSNTGVEGGAIFAARNCHLTVIGGNFLLNRAIESGGAISSRMAATYSVSGANITSNYALQGGAMEISNVLQGYITNTNFQNNIAKIGGGGISAQGKTSLNLRGSVVRSNTAPHGGGLYASEESSVVVSSSTFDENLAVSGGAFYGNGKANIVIRDQSMFAYNKAEQRAAVVAASFGTDPGVELQVSCGEIRNDVQLRGLFRSWYLKGKLPFWYDYFGMNSSSLDVCMSAGGAGFMQDEATLNLYYSSFKGNTAIRGGAIHLNIDTSNALNFENTNFASNQALQGGAIYWDYKGKEIFVLKECSFEDNLVANLATQSLGAILGWWPEAKESLKSGLPIVQGGLEQDATSARNAMRPYVIATDYYGNRALTNSKSRCLIAEWPAGETQGSSLDHFVSNMNGGIAEFYSRGSFKNSLIVKGDIGQLYNFAISCTANDGNSNAFEPVHVNITIDPCSPGEALDSSRMCAPCKEGTYSPKGESCLDCPEGGICSRNYIDDNNHIIKLGVPFPAIQPGYWLGPAKDTWIGGGRHCNFLPNVACRYEGGNDWKERVQREHERGWCEYDAKGCVPGEKKIDEEGDCEAMKDVTAERMFNCYTYPGYGNGDNLHFYRCPLDKHSCKGSEYNCKGWLCEYGVGLPQQANGTGQCNEGYVGVLCGVCEKNYFRAGDKTCKTCVGAGDPELTATLYAVGSVCFFAFMMLAIQTYLRDDDGAGLFKAILCCIHGKKKNDKTKIIPSMSEDPEDLNNAGRSAAGDDLDYSKSWYFRPEKFKIMLAFIQIYSGFKGTYNVTWPWLVSEYMRQLSGFNLDLLQLAALDCIYRGGFYFGMSFVLLLTVSAFVFLFIALQLGRMKYHSRLLRNPRRCILTGKKIKEWMGADKLFALRLKAAKEAMADADLRYNENLLKQRLRTNGISLKPSGYTLRKATKTQGISHTGIQEIVRHNTRIWRQRILERMNHIRYENKLWKLLFWMLLLSYPSISVRVVSFFNCKEIGHSFYLAKDLSLMCFDTAWALYTPVAITALVVYVAGVPSLFFYVLYKARGGNVNWNMDVAKKNEKRKKHFLKEAEIDAKISMKFWAEPLTLEDELKAIKAFLERRNMRDHINYNRIGFIYYAYDEDAWFYEIVELMRKLILNGFAVLISPGTTSQIVFGLFVCFGFMILVMVVQPYTASTDHILAVLCHIQLFLTLFCALMIRSKVEFVSTSVFPDPTERRLIEEAIISWFAVLSHGGLLLFGLFSIFYEKFWSKEIKELHKRKKHRDNMRKQALRKHHEKVFGGFGKKSKLKGLSRKANKLSVDREVEPTINVEVYEEQEHINNSDNIIEETEEKVHIEELDDVFSGILLGDSDEETDVQQQVARKPKLKKQATTVML